MPRLVGLLVAAAALVVAPAAAAESLTAAIEPPEIGTPTASKPVDVKLALTVEGAKRAAKITTVLPAELASRLDRFGSCPYDTVLAKGPSGCPKNAVIGDGHFAATIPGYANYAFQTKQVVLYRAGAGKVALWWKAEDQGASFTHAAPGTVSGNAVTWDFSEYAVKGLGGYTLALSTLSTNFRRTTLDLTTPPKKKKKLSCTAKAKRMKNAKKRRAALRRCKKRKPARPRAATTVAPFETTGCPASGWAFTATVAYADGSEGKAAATLPCSGQAPPPPPPPPKGLLCPPLCLSASDAGARSPSAAPALRGSPTGARR